MKRSREAFGQMSLDISSLENPSLKIPDMPEVRPVTDVPINGIIPTPDKNVLNDTLSEDKPIGLTPNGLQLMYRGENNSLMYTIDKKEVEFRTDMRTVFRDLNTRFLTMQAMGDIRDIFYIPLRTRLTVQAANLNSKPYPADTGERFFVIRNDIIEYRDEVDKNGNNIEKSRKIAYEPLEGFGRRILIQKIKDDFSDPKKELVKIAKDRKFFIPKKYLEGERYFNLTRANVFGDFDQFCDFIKKCDRTAQESKLLNRR